MNLDLSDEPVTTMYTALVKPDKVSEFKVWLAGVNGAAKRRPGFISVDVITSQHGELPEYITLLKFDRCENLKSWNESPELATWIEQLPKFLATPSHMQERVGLELWFDRPTTNVPLPQPPYWKRVVIGVICVYPLVIFLGWALSPVTQHLPSKLGLFLNVITLSSLLTYPVMPTATRLLRSWLYPTSKQVPLTT